ncbi:MAG: RluA family pseudouridine synthase, partial [Alphaproteobacteria bacterium]|nr:RluA family pseudouridine synthase [Alphaproteobacteria bacterium]
MNDQQTKKIVVEQLLPDQKRLDKFLAEYLNPNSILPTPIKEQQPDEGVEKKDQTTVSRSYIQQWIRKGAVLLNDQLTLSPDHRLRVGDTITITIPPLTELTLQPEKMPLNILAEDDDLLVLVKQAGITVHPSISHVHGTLVHGLLYHCGHNLSGINGVLRPGIVHRLDKDTSGIMVVAKNDLAHQRLSAAFSARHIRRRYIALAWGLMAEPLTPGNIGIINQPLGRNPHNRLQIGIVPPEKGGRLAETHYRILQKTHGVTLLECRLMTGRTHQIRAHLTHLHNPLVGDAIYGAKARQPVKDVPADAATALTTFPRQCLHAFELGFNHPRTGQPMHFLAPPPKDMMTLFTTLGLTEAIAQLMG